MDELIYKIKVEAAEAKKQLAEVNKKIKEFEKSQSRVEKKAPNFGSVLKSSFMAAAAAIAGAVVALRGLVKIVSQSIQAFAKQEASVVSLNKALKNTGIYTKELSKDLQRFSAELQQTTGVADEVTNVAMANIQAQASLSAEQLKSATKAAIDLSAAMGIDLNTASTLIGKSLGSSTNALSRYGIATEGAVGSSQRFDSLIGNINDKFGGFAAAQVETYAGQVELLSNNFGDAQEDVGKVVTAGLQPMIKQLNQLVLTLRPSEKQLTLMAAAATVMGNKLGIVIDSIGDMATVFKDSESDVNDFISVLDLILIPFNYLATEAKFLEQTIQNIIELYKAAKAYMEGDTAKAEKIFTDLQADVASNFEEIKNIWKSSADGFVDAMAEMEDAYNGFQDNINGGGAAGEATADSLLKAFENRINAASTKKEIEDILSEAINVLSEEDYASLVETADEALKKIADSANENGEKIKEALSNAFTGIIDSISTIYDSIAEKAEQTKDRQIAALDEWKAAALDAVTAKEEYDAAASEKEKMSLANQVEFYKLINNQKSAADAQEKLDEINATEAQAAAEEAIETEYANKKAAAEATAEAKALAAKQKAFKLEQASSIANSTMSMAESIIKAWTMGPILGPIFAALATATGIAQLAAIKAQNPPSYAEGGLIDSVIPASTTPMGDDGLAYVGLGEGVISKAAMGVIGEVGLKKINQLGNTTNTQNIASGSTFTINANDPQQFIKELQKINTRYGKGFLPA